MRPCQKTRTFRRKESLKRLDFGMGRLGTNSDTLRKQPQDHSKSY